jgi:putative DNA primase/helicase
MDAATDPQHDHDSNDAKTMNGTNGHVDLDMRSMILGGLTPPAPKVGGADAANGSDGASGTETAAEDVATQVIAVDDHFRLLPSALPVSEGPVPGPRQPDAVARFLLYLYAREGVHLKHWRDDWYLWRGARTGGAYQRLTGADNRYAVADSVRSVLSDAKYTVTTKDTVDVRDWAPSRTSVTEVVEAMAAQSRPSESMSAGTWLVDWDEREKGTPGAEVTCVANGLLWSPRAASADVGVGAGLERERERTLLPHTPEFFTDTAVAVAWEPGARCGRWMQFLEELWPGDGDSQALLQEWFGYVLTGDTSLQKMLTLIGPKRSGKGTVSWVMEQLLGGSRQVDHPTMASLATNFGLAGMLGKRLAIIGDARIAKSDPAIVERLLMISGEDPITIDRKHQSPIVAKLDARIVILSNDLPDLRDTTGALASRLIPLTTEASFFGREDLGLKAKLGSELPGVLRWAMEGADRLWGQGGRFTTGTAVQGAMRDAERAGSPVIAFAQDCLEFEADAYTLKTALYDMYVMWTTDAGFGVKGKNVFFRDLKAAFAGQVNTDAKLPPSQGRTPIVKGVRVA